LYEMRNSGHLFLLLSAPTQDTGRDPQTWQRLIGDHLVEARLDTLPENRMHRSAFAISSSVQLALIVALVSLPLFFPERLSLRTVYQVTPVAALLTEAPIRVAQPVEQPESHSVPAPPIDPPAVAKLRSPPLIAPKPRAPEPQNVDVPKLDPVQEPTKIDASLAEPERPREPVKTGVLDTDSAAPPTLRASLDKVQTGGFGDPSGFASDKSEAKHGNVGRVGSFELPSGPGYGNGTAGANGARGVVASAGFGNPVALTADMSRAHGAVQPGRFGTVEIVPVEKSAPKKEEAPAIQPVVILSKPTPVYTDEARKLGIEGEVMVEVNFQASGEVQTVRVVKGLGHGLDEAALRAAQQIRFKPALQEGHAVDFPAIAHIIFQLAF
jgi:TonB family protein